MDAIECLMTRRSVRRWTGDPVPRETIEQILECGRWAPSGINIQPWRVFAVTNEEKKKELATCTDYGKMIENAPCVLAIFLNTEQEYSYVKNVQSMGAFFENILLAIHALGLGGVWVGQIYNNKEAVHEVLGVTDPKMEFMGAIAFGYPKGQGRSDRKELNEFVTFIE
jgi:nitroreductase